MALHFDREGRVRAACRNSLTVVGCHICASHILQVWDIIPKYIVEELQKGFGFRIPGLLTFGFKAFENNSYSQMVTLEKHVHIVLSGDFHKYGLKSNRPLYSLSPVTNLNLSKISCDLNMPRHAVEACLGEVIQAFKRAIVTCRQVNFIFEGIGQLIVRNNIVYDQFDPCFLCTYGFGRRQIQYKTFFPCECEEHESNT